MINQKDIFWDLVNSSDVLPILLNLERLANDGNIDLIDDQKRTPLLMLCQNESDYAYIRAIELGANIHSRDDSGLGLCHYTILFPEKLSNVLNSYDVDINLQTFESGYTPLHLSCIYGEVQSVKALINKGAFIDARDNRGFTPLHHAIEMERNHIIHILLNAGADTTIKGLVGDSAFEEAVRTASADIVEAFLNCNFTVSAELAVSISEIVEHLQRRDIYELVQTHSSNTAKKLWHAMEHLYPN